MPSTSQLLLAGKQAALDAEKQAADVPPLTQSDAWRKLKAIHEQRAKELNLNQLFASDAGRFTKFR